MKLGKGDKRVGNFIYHLESDHIKISDINGVITHRHSLFTSNGMGLETIFKDDNVQAMENYAVVMFNVIGCFPDGEFLAAINKAAVECIQRHPEIYGVDPEISEEKDAEILKEEKELKESMDVLENHLED